MNVGVEERFTAIECFSMYKDKNLIKNQAYNEPEVFL